VKGNRLLLNSLRGDNNGIYKCRAQTTAGELLTRAVVNFDATKRKRTLLRASVPSISAIKQEVYVYRHPADKNRNLKKKHTDDQLHASKSNVFGSWFATD
jgi:hypothetical protein